MDRNGEVGMNCKECLEYCRQEEIEPNCEDCLQGVFEDVEEW